MRRATLSTYSICLSPRCTRPAIARPCSARRLTCGARCEMAPTMIVSRRRRMSPRYATRRGTRCKRPHGSRRHWRAPGRRIQRFAQVSKLDCHTACGTGQTRASQHRLTRPVSGRCLSNEMETAADGSEREQLAHTFMQDGNLVMARLVALEAIAAYRYEGLPGGFKSAVHLLHQIGALDRRSGESPYRYARAASCRNFATYAFGITASRSGRFPVAYRCTVRSKDRSVRWRMSRDLAEPSCNFVMYCMRRRSSAASSVAPASRTAAAGSSLNLDASPGSSSKRPIATAPSVRVVAYNPSREFRCRGCARVRCAPPPSVLALF